MAFIVLFSSFSFTVSSHYCGDTLIDSSIFSTAEDCKMRVNHNDDCDSEEMVVVCNDNNEMHCKNIEKSVEGENHEREAFSHEKLPDLYFSIALVSFYQNLVLDYEKKAFVHNAYQSPLVKEDITVLFENFRI